MNENELLEAYYSDWPKYERLTMRQPGKTQKLTDEQVAELRRLGATKQYSYDQLGKRFGISLSYVGRLLKRGNKR